LLCLFVTPNEISSSSSRAKLVNYYAHMTLVLMCSRTYVPVVKSKAWSPVWCS